MTVATYQSLPGGADGSDEVDGHHESGNGEHSTLLFKGVCNTILGTGMLSMPYAVASWGSLPGGFLILVCGCMSWLGLHFLSRAATHTKPARSSSFAALADITYPKASILFDSAIAIKCSGVATSYLIIIGSLMPRVVKSFDKDPPDWLLDRHLWIVVAMAILSPLCYLRQLHSLRFTSYIAVVAAVDLVFVVIYKFFDRSGLEPSSPKHLFAFSSSSVANLPVYIFAFTCAQNIFSCYNELKENTKGRMNLVTGVSIGSAALIYELVGVLGYITFGENTPPNILSAYHDTLFINICRFGIVLCVLFGYPLQILPARNSLQHLSSGQDTAVKHILLTTVLLFVTFLVSMNVDHLAIVLGIIGSTGSTTISFILPALFYLKLFPKSEWRGARTCARILLCLGVIIMCVCLALNMWHAVTGR
ncbi:hypothetical protein P389DRAFT_205609 [Cystobasidium minutum MCA 4210]|uniref:uncharacterized protein n=1 Tax=Cystobasidium minutum MCA 4210 TaxID=1397322 RepID=UPI0034CFFF7E|eukprot:jgi/Rhomi1/205609/MIX6438_877_41